MKKAILLLTMLCYGTLNLIAQTDYIVTTPSDQGAPASEEEQFIKANFPLVLLCKWTPGMKFMFVPSRRDLLLPILSVYDTEKDADNNSLRHKILTFTGTEEKVQQIANEINYSTRFLFETEGKKYYYEVKNARLEEICQKNPRAYINGFVYLKDVDTAKDLLIGRKIYVQSESVRVDDSNSYAGYREIAFPANSEVIVTAVGVGSQAYPVKIIFRDTEGHSYYLEVALSRTNSGMDVSDFQAEKKMKYFTNAISFNSKNLGNLAALSSKYIDLSVYPKRTLPVKKTVGLENKQKDARVHLPRYTVLKIKEITPSSSGSLAVLSLQDRQGARYEIEVDLRYDVIVKNENYIEDLFGFGNIRNKYPGITERRWEIISRGELEEGMSTDECRLSIGNPVEIQLKKDSRFETWFYNGKTLEFESGTLLRFK